MFSPAESVHDQANCQAQGIHLFAVPPVLAASPVPRVQLLYHRPANRAAILVLEVLVHARSMKEMKARAGCGSVVARRGGGRGGGKHLKSAPKITKSQPNLHLAVGGKEGKRGDGRTTAEFDTVPTLELRTVILAGDGRQGRRAAQRGRRS